MFNFLKSLSIPVVLATVFVLAAIILATFVPELSVLAVVLAITSITFSLISYRELL